MAYRPTPPPATSPRHSRGSVQCSSTPSPTEAVTTVTAVTRLLEMSFEEFSEAEFIVEIRVSWWHETLWLVPNPTAVDALIREGVERRRIWTAAELADLYQLDTLQEKDRRVFALLKLHFGIEILSLTEWSEENTDNDDAGPGPCRACTGTRFWQSVHGVTVCALCHPPADEKLVAEWIESRPGVS